MRFSKFIKHSALSISFLVTASPAFAQSLFPALQTEILGNNPTLLAGAGQTQSNKAENLTGLTLANPDASVSYMFGSPSGVPNKTNVEVSQTLDFPTLSGAKRRVALASNRMEDVSYLTLRSQIATEVESAIINYIYLHLRMEQLKKMAEERTTLLETASKSLEAGNINYLEYNALSLSSLEAENELEQVIIELSAAENELTRLNGGIPLNSLPDTWPLAEMPHSFDVWYDAVMPESPELLALQAQMLKAKEEINLRKKEGLPEISIGYVNELVPDNNYHGAAIGFSLPLWGNSGRVKAAKASYASAQVNLQTATDSFRAAKQTEFNKAQMLLRTAQKYEEAYRNAVEKSEKYLNLALEKKTISLMEYMSAKADLLTYAQKSLDAMRDYQQARVALYAPAL